MSIVFLPVTRGRWPDLERLFSASGGEALGNPSRCWCMEWRLASHEEWEKGAEAGGKPNREGMRRFVASGEVPGIIAYVDGEPAGWCSVSPRPSLIGLKTAAEYRNFEDPNVWVVICFYVPETQRGKGMMLHLLEAAMRYAAENGARVVEGYPFEAAHAGDGAGGTIEAFERAGFKEVRRVSEHQAVMRWYRQRTGSE